MESVNKCCVNELQPNQMFLHNGRLCIQQNNLTNENVVEFLMWSDKNKRWSEHVYIWDTLVIPLEYRVIDIEE